MPTTPKPVNPPAFPTNCIEKDKYFHEGMTLRDYFAAAAMPLFTRTSAEIPLNVFATSMAEQAYAIADAMLKAREG